jgi:hypothetical protein
VKEQEFVLEQLQEEVTEKTNALKQAQANELSLLKDKRELQEAKETLELKVQRTLDQERGKITAHAKAQADEENRLKIAEKGKGHLRPAAKTGGCTAQSRTRVSADPGRNSRDRF